MQRPFRFVIHTDEMGYWNWHLEDALGERVTNGSKVYSDAKEAEFAIRIVMALDFATAIEWR